MWRILIYPLNKQFILEISKTNKKLIFTLGTGRPEIISKLIKTKNSNVFGISITALYFVVIFILISLLVLSQCICYLNQMTNKIIKQFLCWRPFKKIANVFYCECTSQLNLLTVKWQHVTADLRNNQIQVESVFASVVVESVFAFFSFSLSSISFKKMLRYVF